MTELVKALLVENTLLKKNGQGFEDFFNELGKCAWGEDFESWKAQGRFGDYKCDGYRVSTKTVFQCYGPETVVPSTVTTKILKDFNGARDHFGDAIKKWVFVFNQKSMPATAAKLLTELRRNNTNILVHYWSPTDLISLALNLEGDKLISLFPELLAGHEFNEATTKALLDYVDKHPRQFSKLAPDAATPTNQLTLDQVLDAIGEDDRELRRKIMGYSMWYDPMSKERGNQLLIELGYTQPSITSNIARLDQEGLIKLTTAYILPLETRICQQAADSLTSEFIDILSDG